MKNVLNEIRKSFNIDAPRCFICFNVEETDVTKWLSNTLVPDLKKIGVKTIFAPNELKIGANLNNFQEQICETECVIIACTPLLKKKVDERKRAPVGAALEIELASKRLEDPKKYETTYLIYLKGEHQTSCPSTRFEPFFGKKLNISGKNTDFEYYFHTLNFFASMRKVDAAKLEKIRSDFQSEVNKILVTYKQRSVERILKQTGLNLYKPSSEDYGVKTLHSKEEKKYMHYLPVNPRNVLKRIDHKKNFKEINDRQERHTLTSMTVNVESPFKRPNQSTISVKCRYSVPYIAFGKADWEKYFGKVELEPPLPPNIEEVLNVPCSFWPNKKVKETHLLVLIPNTVNGKPFTLNHLEELIQKPKSGHSTKYRFYNRYAKAAVGGKSYPSHWVLMTRDIISGSRGKSYRDCCYMVDNHSKKTGISYESPSVLEATTSILMHYVKTGKRLYSDDPVTWTYTRDVDKDGDSLIIGDFVPGGLSVGYGGIGGGSGIAVFRVLR